jgi:geranylgeranyl pyrophosphate synthase
MQELRKYKTLIDVDIATYSETLAGRWQTEFGLETAQILDSYLAILARGGKRLRGSLGMWAYFSAGGKDDNLALHIARTLEMIHAYLLVIDDVADQAQARRNGPSAHALIKKYHDEQTWFGNSEHFSEMQAINAGLAAQHMIMQEITELAAVDSLKLEALRELNAILFKTVAGQIADLNFQAMRDVSEHEVIAEMQQKTAYYSFVSPLQFGTIMAGKDWSDYAWLEGWACNIGLGFQINDDILGVFGDEKVSGKSSLSDVREGKMSLMVVRALDHGSDTQKSNLLRLLGKQDLTQAELEQVQTVLEDTGALDYCQDLARTYATKAISALEAAPAEYATYSGALKTLSQMLVTRHS